MIRVIYIILLLTISLASIAQIGGGNTYDFLTKPNSARLGALGGNHVGLYDNDLNLQFHNPGMLTDSVSNQIVMNYVPMPAGIRYGYFAYARNVKKFGTVALGIHNVNYGEFIGHDVYDNEIGLVNAVEYAVLLSYSKRLSNNIIGGLTFKPVISNLWHYNSFALLSDIGFSYRSNSQLFSAGIVLKNLGSQLTTYDGVYESVPTDLQIGLSNKLAHAPFRFSFTFQGLLDWDLDYELDMSENGSALSSDDDDKIKTFDNIMQHMVFGLEFLPFKNFYIAMGYNHRIRKEMMLDEKASTVGYSWGFGLRIYKFKISYASARYHLASTSNFFSLTTNLSSFGIKK